MKKFRFSSEEIENHKAARIKWANFVRRREAEVAFSLFPDRRFKNALELGAGDGGQSVTISRYCDKLICTEYDEKSHSWLGQTILERHLPDVDYMICDAQDLSRFNDCSFDLVFSSNMLEHILDVDKCLSECKRVLSDDGLMLHFMPNRWWRFFSSILTIFKLKVPRTHGISSNLVKEFYIFGAQSWKKRFEKNKLKVKEIVGMPFYVGHGNSFIPVIKAGNALGLSASFLYIIAKK